MKSSFAASCGSRSCGNNNSSQRRNNADAHLALSVNLRKRILKFRYGLCEDDVWLLESDQFIERVMHQFIPGCIFCLRQFLLQNLSLSSEDQYHAADDSAHDYASRAKLQSFDPIGRGLNCGNSESSSGRRGIVGRWYLILRRQGKVWEN